MLRADFAVKLFLHVASLGFVGVFSARWCRVDNLASSCTAAYGGCTLDDAYCCVSVVVQALPGLWGGGIGGVSAYDEAKDTGALGAASKVCPETGHQFWGAKRVHSPCWRPVGWSQIADQILGRTRWRASKCCLFHGPNLAACVCLAFLAA